MESDGNVMAHEEQYLMIFQVLPATFPKYFSPPTEYKLPSVAPDNLRPISCSIIKVNIPSEDAFPSPSE